MSWLLLYLRLSSAAIAATEIHYQKLDPSLWLERTPTSAFIAYCVHIFFGVANLFLCPCNFTIFSFSFQDKTAFETLISTHILLHCSVPKGDLHCQCILSIFPARVHQFYANTPVFVNINPFLYINDQFALRITCFIICLAISSQLEINHVFQEPTEVN